MILSAVASTLVPEAAFAHALSVSYARLTIGERSVAAIVRLPLDDLDLLLRLDRDLDGRVSPEELTAARPVLQPYITRHFRVRADGVLLPMTIDRLALWSDPARFSYLEAALTLEAPEPIGSVAVESDVLVELYPKHRTLTEIVAANISEQVALAPGASYERRLAERHPWRTGASFVRLGIEHIFTGYDHILFLFGLLLVGRGLRNLVAVVTSFTIAHSITLALATLGAVEPVPWTIEAAIALSIAYIGLENLFVREPRYRWKITFLFGLVHGFGFAAVLRDMHLPRTGLAMSLFGFNIGVEVGQIAIVSLMYPALVMLSRTAYRTLVMRVASSAIAVVGLIWFYQRIP